MSYMYSKDNSLKTVTVYLIKQLYETYQVQAKKQGRKASELIREAMEEYAERNFGQKKSLSELSFNRTVRLRSGAKDFLTDDYKSDFLDDEVSE
ncbi:MAG: ribbon-helix-helix domain-containing protein [Treponema sp.]|nr:ribbon-helix-helix domain-containing protein [Treponema sp.]